MNLPSPQFQRPDRIQTGVGFLSTSLGFVRGTRRSIARAQLRPICDGWRREKIIITSDDNDSSRGRRCSSAGGNPSARVVNVFE